MRVTVRPLRRLAAVLAVGCAGAFATPAAGQEVTLAGEPRSEAQTALLGLLDAGGYTLWVRDTVLARADTVPGPILVLEASVRIAGRIEGDIYVVDGDLFLRSGASVRGDLLVLGGGFYDSDLAEVVGAVTYRPNERLRVRPHDGGFEIFSEVVPEPAFELDGTYGLRLPTYDRANGLSFPVGARARLSRAPGRPELALGATWIPARGDVDARLHNSWHLGEGLQLGLFAASAVTSNEAWIRPAWTNSLAHFVAGDDVRNHYDTRIFGLETVWRSPTPPVWEDPPTWRFTVSAGRESARHLPARDVTVLFGDRDGEGDHRNGDADARKEHRNGDGDAEGGHGNGDFDGAEWPLWFARAGFEWEAMGRGRRTAFGLGVEAGFAADRVARRGGGEPRRTGDAAADDRCALDDGACDFLLLEGRLAVRRATPWGHVVDAFAIGRVDLAGRVPASRYSALGGLGTLPVLPLRGLKGSRLLYAEAAYAIPLVGDPELGGLDVFARGSVGGTGWPEDGLALYGAVQGGLALRLWDVRLEFGAAAGSTIEPDDPGLIAFLDIRTRRSARSTRMDPPR